MSRYDVKFDFHAEEPDDIMMTMEITLPLWRWRRLYDQLGGLRDAPSYWIREHTRDLIDDAEKHFERSFDGEEEKDAD